MQRVFLFFIFLTISLVANAQSITNVKARQEDKKIIVNYDITGGTVGMLYDVKLFLSEDGGYSWEGPMCALTGDAGGGITEGIYKQITWDVLSEPGRQQLIGNMIAFKIQVLFYPDQSPPGTTAGSLCPGLPITDPRDGQVYPTVKIGSQCWLQKNMNYQTGNSWCYRNKSKNCDIYGRLYDWETALKVCPNGWHLPSDDEWRVLTDYLGEGAGCKMKSTSGWKNDGNGTNTSGFTALAAGGRGYLGGFYSRSINAYFWSSLEDGTTNACYRGLNNGKEDVGRYGYYRAQGFSCRCLKD